MIKSLFDFQVEAVAVICDSPGDVGIEFPTGSGKTLLGVAAIARLLAAGKRVLIAAPQGHLEAAFAVRDYDEVMVGTDVLAVPAALIRAARNEDKSSVRAIQAYLAVPNPGYALVCTHAALTNPLIRPPTGIPGQTDAVLILDEGHHVGASGLGQFTEAWKLAGGAYVVLTATAYRTDGTPVILPGMTVLRRGLAEHMEAGFAPASLETKVVGIRADDVTEDEFAGERLPAIDLQIDLTREMVTTWVAAHRPKTVVRVPGIRGGTSTLVGLVISAFERAGARVLDASGTTNADAKRVSEALQAERQVTRYADSQYDVIVGIQRVREGLDWPLCSAVYTFGLPRAVSTVVQLMGRAARQKTHTGYPAGHRDKMTCVFFVPCPEGGFEAMPDYHRRYTLLVCAFLANSAAGEQWNVIRDLGRGVTVGLGEPIGTRAVTAAYPYIDPQFRARALVEFAAVRRSLLASGSTAPDVDVLNEVYARRPDWAKAPLKQIMVEFIVSRTGEDADRVKKHLNRAIADEMAKGFDLNQAIKTAFDTVAFSLDSYAVVQSTLLDDLVTSIVTLTGSEIREVAEALATWRPLSPDWLGRAVMDWRAREARAGRADRWPSGQTAGGPPGWIEETWSDIDQAIRAGRRDWPLASVRSLREFVRIYTNHGPIRHLLERFATELQLDEVERAFLSHLLAQRVAIRGETIPFGDLPVPSTAGAAWPDNVWWVAKWWAESFEGLDTMPMADVYATVLYENLNRWLTNKDHTAMPDVSSSWNTIRRRYDGLPVVLVVPGEHNWKVDGEPALRLAHGAIRNGVVDAHSGGAARPVRTDGVMTVHRHTVSRYREPELYVEIGERLVIVPAGWVTKIGEVDVSRWWEFHLKRLPVITYTRRQVVPA